MKFIDKTCKEKGCVSPRGENDKKLCNFHFMLWEDDEIERVTGRTNAGLRIPV